MFQQFKILTPNGYGGDSFKVNGLRENASKPLKLFDGTGTSYGTNRTNLMKQNLKGLSHEK